MRNFKHLASAALLAVCGVTGVVAQNYSDCGCPPVASRPEVNLSTKVVAYGDTTTSGNLLGSITLSCDTTYILNSRVYVLPGQTLTIQAGTVVKGKKSSAAANANAVVVSRGGKIYAQGTESCPIIFTAYDDQLDGNYSDTISAQWGGIIVLGKAFNNTKTGDGLTVPAADGGQDGIAYIEGLRVPDARHHYGESAANRNDDDNSGVISYVSIRHAGAILGAANEINGLTLGSVGRGTQIDHVEIVANEDDGIEFFGGTVDVKHIICMFNKDDNFDWDQGYSGRGQFIYSVQYPTVGNHGFELDGQDVTGRTPYSNARFFNATIIGNNNASNMGIEAKAQTQGEVSNSIFANFAQGVRLNSNVVPFHTDGTWVTKNNAFVNVATLISPASEATKFATEGNAAVTITGFDYTLELNASGDITGKVNPVPSVASEVSTTYYAPADGFFERVNYKGAFKPGVPAWNAKWGTPAIGNPVVCPTDINNSNKTDIDDLLELISNFNGSCN